ncbi:hypothetical protein [Phyllobacterium sp. K27]
MERERSDASSNASTARSEGLVTGERNIELLRMKLEGLGNRQRASGATPIYRG